MISAGVRPLKSSFAASRRAGCKKSVSFTVSLGTAPAASKPSSVCSVRNPSETRPRFGSDFSRFSVKLFWLGASGAETPIWATSTSREKPVCTLSSSK